MSRKLDDITGRVFGRLTVIKLLNERNVFKSRMWLCKCICGKYKKTTGTNLKKGDTKSCGCLQREAARRLGLQSKKYSTKEDGARRVFSMYNLDSRRRNGDIPFNITFDTFFNMILQPCTYCGLLESNTHKFEDGRYFKYNGIDRIDSNKGYVEGNITACCFICNRAKGNLSIEEWKNGLGE